MIIPALHFNGKCLEAIEMYDKAFGVTSRDISMYDDAPSGSGLNEDGTMFGKVMHAEIVMAGDSKLNMSDEEEPVITGTYMCLNIFLKSAEAVERAYAALKEEGSVKVPIGEQFFSPRYAAVFDKFGILWQLIS